ncbi:MAG: PH domain-containing protein, partial [Candidatus Hodarchaeota archaeon]
MSKVQSSMTLAEGESVLWQGRRSYTSMWYLIVIGIVTTVILIGFYILYRVFLAHQRTEYVITNRRVYSSKGLISREARDTTLEKITDASLSQG